MPFGRMYFDGIYWRICGQNNKVNQEGPTVNTVNLLNIRTDLRA